MIKELDENNSLYISRLYPYKRVSKSLKPYSVLLGIGGNIGDVKRRFNHLFVYLQKSPYITIIETSPILKNPPFGYLDQDDFYNSLIYIKTSLKPKALLGYILRIEKQFGRKRLFVDAPRTLDIDIIFYEKIKMRTERLNLPHPSWKKRDSVLVPMGYMKSRYIKEVSS